jgi:hypothetical protein
MSNQSTNTNDNSLTQEATTVTQQIVKTENIKIDESDSQNAKSVTTMSESEQRRIQAQEDERLVLEVARRKAERYKAEQAESEAKWIADEPARLIREAENKAKWEAEEPKRKAEEAKRKAKAEATQKEEAKKKAEMDKKISEFALPREERFKWMEEADQRKVMNKFVERILDGVEEMLYDKPHLMKLKQEELVSIWFEYELEDLQSHACEEFEMEVEMYGLREALTMFAKGIKKPRNWTMWCAMWEWAWERRSNPSERSRTKKVEPITEAMTILYEFRPESK